MALRTVDYKWVALSNTTLAMLLATIDTSIVIVAMPDVFRGVHLNPLGAGNSFYLLWMIVGYLVVTSVLVVSFGRLGDIYGRVRMYTIGFAVYTASSLLLTVDWLSGHSGAAYLVGFRIVQGIGAAFLLANAPAILTDAFPSNQRGLALGLMNVVGIAGMFLGLVLGGVLAPIDWRLIFLVSVPFGVFGTVWSHRKLKERGIRRKAPIDWLGNLTFAGGLILIMIGITYGIRPYGGAPTGWGNPIVIGSIATGLALLAAFVLVEHRVASPMFRLSLFRIRPFTFGVSASFLSAIARGGLMFMLIIWLQGIWLPRHGYSFAATPLWAGLCMLPLTVGILLAGPTAGYLSDKFGARVFATGGMLGSALGFVLLDLLPIDFSYWAFAAILLLMGLSMGAFAAPNRAGVMNSLPAPHRGAGGGMNQTFQNSAQVLSIGIFFTLMINGLSSSLPATLSAGLHARGVPVLVAAHVGHLPPISVLFAAFLGYNPVKELIGPHVLGHLTAANSAALTGHSYFPSLISGPFQSGLHEAFTFAIVACLAAAAASWSRGGRYVHEETPQIASQPEQSGELVGAASAPAGRA
jgi:MFS family permease